VLVLGGGGVLWFLAGEWPAIFALAPGDGAAVATLTAGQESEVVGEATGEDLDDFGLMRPVSEIEVTVSGETETPLRVLLGANNPTKTALYAKRADRPNVYLVGGNLRYYQDLIFEAAAGGPRP